MELGQRLKQARLELGLSQRQLCEELITRNMLSQIENGSARPSMDVLRTLAGRLGKTVSYFLEEDAVLSANQSVMERAREAFAIWDWERVQDALADYREPDGVFDSERALLEAMCCLALAKQALEENRRPLAVQLLERAAEFGEKTPYYGAALKRQRCLLLARLQPEALGQLPDIDEELCLRGKAALVAGDARRAAEILDAAENKTAAEWNLLRGEAAMMGKEHKAAAAFFHRAEEKFPAETSIRLETCYRELEDYKMAYFYACKQK